jgi:uncharacterized protein (TIGR03066 family)
MNALRLMAAGFLMVGLVAGVRAEEKKADANKEKIVGTWEVVKSEEPPPPVGAVVEFAKDGKLKVMHKQDDKEVTIEGTYTVEGDKISVLIKRDDQEIKHTITIKKVGADTISAENDKGKAVEFKRKKSTN